MTKNHLDIASLAVAIAGGILAVSNQLIAIPGLPGWLTCSWPVVLALATLVDRIGNIVLRVAPAPMPALPIETLPPQDFAARPIQPMPALPQSKIP